MKTGTFFEHKSVRFVCYDDFEEIPAEKLKDLLEEASQNQTGQVWTDGEYFLIRNGKKLFFSKKLIELEEV